MTESNDDRLDAYLWDPRAEPHPSVVALEKRLAPCRFDPDARPLAVPAGRPRAMRSVNLAIGWLAAAATIVIVTGFGLFTWRGAWPEGHAWTVKAVGKAAPPLSVGNTLKVGPGEEALVGIARIGTMRVSSGSAVTLRATRSDRHRLALAQGAVHVRVWAPPMSVAIQTPAGTVVDLGCEFELKADELSSHVRVLSGWVQMENSLAEILVPAGASSSMTTTSLPGVPVYDDAPLELRDAVRRLERSPTADEPTVQQIARHARQRDMLTLLMLVWRDAPGRERLAARAAELQPPPGGVTVEGVLAGDRDGFWKWHDSLQLPSPKKWLYNWRDGLPLWMVSPRR
jgi:hypothetical protein